MSQHGNILLQLFADAERIPPSLLIAHDHPLKAGGTMRVVRTLGKISSILGKLLRLPPPARKVPVTIDVTDAESFVRWERNFGDFRVCSRQFVRKSQLMEAVGPAAFYFALRFDNRSIHYDQTRFTICGVPVPAAIAPRIVAAVTAGEGDAWHVRVDIFVPSTRPLCRYQGWMKRK